MSESKRKWRKHRPSGSWWWRGPASGILAQSTWRCTSPAPGRRTWVPPPRWCWWAASPWSPTPGRNRWCWGERGEGANERRGWEYSRSLLAWCWLARNPPLNHLNTYTVTHTNPEEKSPWKQESQRGIGRPEMFLAREGRGPEGRTLTWWHGMAPRGQFVQNSGKNRPWRYLGSGKRPDGGGKL